MLTALQYFLLTKTAPTEPHTMNGVAVAAGLQQHRHQA